MSDTPSLDISTDKVAFIIERAREVDAKEALTDPDPGSNPADDNGVDILEDSPFDGTRQELADAVRALNEDERLELVALAWLGRGTYDITEWNAALATARAEHLNRTADYLLELPLLADYLEEGLEEFGIGIVDDEEPG
ncbi:MAG: DUF3775 domain-containing protein [Alphaproteobacteria bacterium]|nr:DUF3775 domain-containing protein [Alphaproteobacteria bacterium]